MRRFSVMSQLMVLLALTACDVHQFPIVEESEPLRVLLDLDYSTEMPLYTLLDYPDGTAQNVSSRADGNYRVRHTVQIFSGTESSRSSWSRSGADYTYTVYRPYSDDLSTQVEVEIPDGPYTAMVWTDYVPVDESQFSYHNVDDFADIHYDERMDYSGSDDMRDAFRGEVEFVVPDLDLTVDNVETVHVDMHRPFGKFTIIATDVQQFISRALSRAGEDPSSVSDSRAFDFTKYKVRLVYTAYMPSSFNMFLNKPVDSRLGVSFNSDIQLMSQDEACLAFDYVMVNGSEAKVDAAVQIVDSDNQVLSQSAPMRIPLMRSKLTEIRGKFLTASSQSGVSIVTEFDDEYNIEIR